MFGRKQRIIETQKALIADLKEADERNHTLIRLQHKQIMQLIEENKTMKRIIMQSSEFKAFVNIDFPNSEKGGSDNTGAVNVSDILNL